jgi:hypothetical protein
MSDAGNNGIGRRDTLKLASAAAALGAGLGVLLDAADATAADAVVAPATLNPNATLQVKLDTYQQLKLDRGLVQFKFWSQAGQLLYAANLPEDVGRNLVNAPGGLVQFKFYQSVPAVDAKGQAMSVIAKEGVLQLKPNPPR